MPPDPAAARLENLRRSIAMAPARSEVTLHKEDALDLLGLVLSHATAATKAER